MRDGREYLQFIVQMNGSFCKTVRGSRGLDEIADTVRPNASWRAFRTERHRREARRVKTAKAVLSNPLGATNRLYFDREFTQ